MANHFKANFVLSLFIILFLSSCNKATEANMCEIISNSEKYNGKYVKVYADVGFSGHGPIIMGENCHNSCALWEETKQYERFKNKSNNTLDLSGAIFEQYKKNGARWADAKIYMEGYIKPGNKNSKEIYERHPRFYVVKVHNYKMLSRAESFETVCGNDMQLDKTIK